MLKEFNPALESLEPQEPGIPESALQFYPHGIDKLTKDRSVGSIYEEKCFMDIVNSLRDGFAIGPHLVNEVFSGRNAQLMTGLRIPDTIYLKPEGESMALERFYEFKTGDRNYYLPKIQGKVEGFSRLAQALRANPDFLPGRLRALIGDHYRDTPAHILIPEDVGVTVYLPEPVGVLDLPELMNSNVLFEAYPAPRLLTTPVAQAA